MTRGGEPWAEHLTLDTILGLHVDGIAQFGGDKSTRDVDRECVEAKLGNAWNAEVYLEPAEHQQGGLVFAGYLLFYLVKAHCFVDGNKRVSWTACMRVLAGRGLTVEATTEEAYTMIQELLTPQSEKSGDYVVGWLAPRLRSAI